MVRDLGSLHDILDSNLIIVNIKKKRDETGVLIFKDVVANHIEQKHAPFGSEAYIKH